VKLHAEGFVPPEKQTTISTN
jgi:hypothetical protein